MLMFGCRFSHADTSAVVAVALDSVPGVVQGGRLTLEFEEPEELGELPHAVPHRAAPSVRIPMPASRCAERRVEEPFIVYPHCVYRLRRRAPLGCEPSRLKDPRRSRVQKSVHASSQASLVISVAGSAAGS